MAAGATTGNGHRRISQNPTEYGSPPKRGRERKGDSQNSWPLRSAASKFPLISGLAIFTFKAGSLLGLGLSPSLPARWCFCLQVITTRFGAMVRQDGPKKEEYHPFINYAEPRILKVRWEQWTGVGNCDSSGWCSAGSRHHHCRRKIREWRREKHYYLLSQ